MAHGLVDVLEGDASSAASGLKHIRDEHMQLLLLVSDLYRVAAAARVGDEPLRLELGEAILQHLTRCMTFLVTELKLIARFLEDLGVLHKLIFGDLELLILHCDCPGLGGGRTSLI